MYYFDKSFLNQYLPLQVDLKVYVNGQILSIADQSDLEDEVYGIGYDYNGAPTSFNYKDIQSIKAGQFELSLDELQDLLSGKKQDSDQKGEEGDQEGEPAPADDEQPPTQAGGEEQPAKQEEEPPTENYYIRQATSKMILDAFEAIKTGRRMYGRVVEITSGPYANNKGWITTTRHATDPDSIYGVKLFNVPGNPTVEVFYNQFKLV